MEYFKIISGIPIHISDSLKKSEVLNPEKPVLLFLHGYLETLYIWSDFIEQFTDRYRVISIDLPGHGLSGSFDINNMDRVAHLISLLLDSLSIHNNVVVIGHSMGGYVALECIKNDSNRYSSIVLLHSTPYSDTPQKILDREREIELIKLNKLQQIASISFTKLFSNPNVIKFEDKIHELVEICEVHDPEGIVSSIKGIMSREDNSIFFTNLQKPKLIVLGSSDNYINEDVSEKLKSSYGSAVVTIQEVGHCSFIESPNISSEILSTFISSLK